MQGGEHSHRNCTAAAAPSPSSSHSIPVGSTLGGAWRPSSSKVARLLSRSTVQLVSDANRLGSLLDSTAPRRFTDQHGSGTAWPRSSHSLLGTQLPTGSRQSHDGPQSVGGVGQCNYGFQQALDVSAKLSANPEYLSWQDAEEASRQGSSKAQAALPVWGLAAQDKSSSSWHSPEWPAQTDNSMSKLHRRASFFSGTSPAATGLAAYRFEASPSHPSLFGGKAAGTASCQPFDQQLKPGGQAVPRSSLISTRCSEQSSLGDVHDADLQDSLYVRRLHSETLHAAQKDSHLGQWQQQHDGRHSSSACDLYSAVSVQPRRARPSLLADAAAKSTKACALSEDLQPEACSSAQAKSLLPMKVLAGQSPVAVALSENSPWNDQPGSLHLRHQGSWHLPTTSQSHIQVQQRQQQPQQLLNQHLSMLHSMASLQSPSRQSLPKSAADAEAPTAGSDVEPDSMQTHLQLASGGLNHGISAEDEVKVCRCIQLQVRQLH